MARRSYTHTSAQTRTKKKSNTQNSHYSRPFPVPQPTQQQATANTRNQQPTPRATYNALVLPVHPPGGTSAAPELSVMPKLAIGPVNDPYEQEADRVAAQVVQQLNAPPSEMAQRYGEVEDSMSAFAVQPLVQRQGAGSGGITAPAGLEDAIQRERSKGQSLAQTVRQPLENAMGADFSSVRIHTDSTANQLSESIQAKAFMTGQDVFFRQGAYDPSSKAGQGLLAHELTHVVQQNGSVSQPSESMDSMVQRIPAKADESYGYDEEDSAPFFEAYDLLRSAVLGLEATDDWKADWPKIRGFAGDAESGGNGFVRRTLDLFELIGR